MPNDMLVSDLIKEFRGHIQVHNFPSIEQGAIIERTLVSLLLNWIKINPNIFSSKKLCSIFPTDLLANLGVEEEIADELIKKIENLLVSKKAWGEKNPENFHIKSVVKVLKKNKNMNSGMQLLALQKFSLKKISDTFYKLDENSTFAPVFTTVKPGSPIDTLLRSLAKLKGSSNSQGKAKFSTEALQECGKTIDLVWTMLKTQKENPQIKVPPQ